MTPAELHFHVIGLELNRERSENLHRRRAEFLKRLRFCLCFTPLLRNANRPFSSLSRRAEQSRILEAGLESKRAEISDEDLGAMTQGELCHHVMALELDREESENLHRRRANFLRRLPFFLGFSPLLSNRNGPFSSLYRKAEQNRLLEAGLESKRAEISALNRDLVDEWAGALDKRDAYEAMMNGEGDVDDHLVAVHEDPDELYGAENYTADFCSCAELDGGCCYLCSIYPS